MKSLSRGGGNTPAWPQYHCEYAYINTFIIDFDMRFASNASDRCVLTVATIMTKNADMNIETIHLARAWHISLSTESEITKLDDLADWRRLAVADHRLYHRPTQ